MSEEIQDDGHWPIKCSACGANDSVPFEPTQGRDVFCRACWAKRRQKNEASNLK